MAFEASDKYRILKFLCYPAKTLTPNSLNYSKILADKLEGLPEEAEDQVVEILDRLDELDDSLKGAVNQSGVKKIDDIEFFGADEGNKLQELRKERNRLIGELSNILDIRSMCKGGFPSMGNVCV